MSKAVDAFRTISEVAADLDVPKHVLRFWEVKFPQVRPMKRGGGRRYYRPEDLDLLRGIRHLLHAEGYTIKGVQKILKKQGIDEVKSCWRQNGGSSAGAVPAAAQAAAPAGRASKTARRVPSARRRGRGEAAVVVLDAARQDLLIEAIAALEECRKTLRGGSGGGAAAEPRRARGRQ